MATTLTTAAITDSLLLPASHPPTLPTQPKQTPESETTPHDLPHSPPNTSPHAPHLPIPGGFRAAYANGVDTFYTNLTSYHNPHYPGIAKVLSRIFSTLPLPPSPLILDLAAGSGEATLAIQTWASKTGSPLQLRFVAADPFTAGLYDARHPGLPRCGRWGFREVSERGLGECVGSEEAVEVVVVSFALHLVKEGEVFAVLYELSRAARWLVVVAPHKKPEVGVEMGWERVGEEVVERVERVRGRVFRSLNVQ